MRFEGFYGNARAKEMLSKAVDSGRPPHAVLLEGPAGSGRFTLAKRLANALVCSAEGTEKPCGRCPDCRKAAAESHPDILVFRSGSGPRSFSVDLVRKIRSDAFILPNEAQKKVFILLNAQNMTESAQNALLKILEEPPAYAVFILTCESRAALLETVVSRCQTIPLGPVSPQEAQEALAGQFPDNDPETLRDAAREAGYVIGRARERLESGGLKKSRELIESFAKALCGSNEYTFLKISGIIEKDEELIRPFFETLPFLFRDAAARKIGVQTSLCGFSQPAALLSGTLPFRNLCSLAEVAFTAQSAFLQYANKQLLLTWTFASLWEAARRVGTPA